MGEGLELCVGLWPDAKTQVLGEADSSACIYTMHFFYKLLSQLASEVGRAGMSCTGVRP